MMRRRNTPRPTGIGAWRGITTEDPGDLIRLGAVLRVLNCEDRDEVALDMVLDWGNTGGPHAATWIRLNRGNHE